MHQDETADDKESRFFKFVKRRKPGGPGRPDAF
jgi:hypothetical protein